MKNKLFNRDKLFYSVNFKIGIVIGLLLCISSFLLSPYPLIGKKEVPYFYEPLISLIDIPNTQQSMIAAPPRPAAPEITSMLELVDEPVPLADIDIKESSDLKGMKDGVTKSSGSTETNVYNASSFPFIPRQILEVIPQNIDGVKGQIKVSVLIGFNGYVKQHKILSNTIESKNCLKAIEEAVYKSRWQPIKIENQKVEYWIEKTYMFN